MSSSENTILARSYAKAVFRLANEQNKLAQWSDILSALAYMGADAQVKKLIADPLISSEQKATFFIEILDQHLHEEARNFIGLLAENARLNVLPEINDIYDHLRAEQEKTKKVMITSAAVLDAAHQESLTSALKKKFNTQIEPTWHVDASVLGGVIIKAGDLVIDGSVKSQLSKLTREMIEG